MTYSNFVIRIYRSGHYRSAPRDNLKHYPPEKCSLSVSEKCPSYREFDYAEIMYKRPGPNVVFVLEGCPLEENWEFTVIQMLTTSSIVRRNTVIKRSDRRPQGHVTRKEKNLRDAWPNHIGKYRRRRESWWGNAKHEEHAGDGRSSRLV